MAEEPIAKKAISSIDDILNFDYVNLPKLEKREDISGIMGPTEFSLEPVKELAQFGSFLLSAPLFTGIAAFGVSYYLNEWLHLVSRQNFLENGNLIYLLESLGLGAIGSLVLWRRKESALQDPRFLGLLSGFSALYVLSSDFSVQMAPSELPIYLSIFAGFGVVGYTLGSRYAEGKKQPLLPENPERAGFFERAKYFALNNPFLTGVATGLGILAFTAYFSTNNLPVRLATTVEGAVWPAVFGGIAAYYLTGLTKANELVKRGFEKYRMRHHETKDIGSRVRDIYDWGFEHPGKVARATTLLADAALIGTSLYNGYVKYGFGALTMKNGLEMTAMLTAASLVCGTFAYLGTSALSWLLHTNSLRLMRDSITEKLDGLVGQYRKAIGVMRDIMEIPTTVDNERKNHLRLGDLQLKAGEVGEGLSEYYKALGLVSQRDSFYSNPVDFLSSAAEVVGLPLIALNSLYHKTRDSLEEIFFRKNDIGSNVRRFASQVRNSSLNMADINLRRLIIENRGNPELHLLYGKFLDVTGDKGYAESEYRAAALLILDDPDIAGKFERVGESRNEVMVYKASSFIRSTLIFKRSRRRDELSEEYENTRAAYERFGERVSKPLLFMERSGMHYIVMEHSGEKNLPELGKNRGMLEEAIDLVLEFQKEASSYGIRI